jgi:hypothetical protein
MSEAVEINEVARLALLAYLKGDVSGAVEEAEAVLTASRDSVAIVR